MEPVYASLTQRAAALQQQTLIAGGDDTTRRVLIALAGPPGSGKTTIAKEVAKRLNAGVDVPNTVVVPMDGFHYTRAVLDTFPDPEEAHARRGAAFTFDAAGVVALVRQLRSSTSGSIYAPGFDHATKDPVMGEIEIPPTASLIILEGNWLLYDEEPWREISKLVDESWFVEVDRDTARDRVAKRHVESGIESTMEAALARAEANDVRNGDEVRQKLIKPTVKVKSVDL